MIDRFSSALNRVAIDQDVNDERVMAVSLITKNLELQATGPRELFRGKYQRFFTEPNMHPAFDVTPDGLFVMVLPNEMARLETIDVVLGWSQVLKRLVPTDN